MSTLKTTNTVPAPEGEKTEASLPSQGARKDDQADLRVMELEERIAPRLASNHNESILVDC